MSTLEKTSRANRGKRPATPCLKDNKTTPAALWGSWTTSRLLLGTLLGLLALVVYIPAMRSGFIWDDDAFLYENPLIHAANGLYRFWFTTEAPDYFPLTSSTLWLEWRLWGMTAAGYHVANVVLHAASSLMFWLCLELLSVPGAWFAGLVFALHPVNVESVAWITERKNSLSMCFYMLSLLLYLHFDEGKSRRWYVASLLAFAASLLSKTASCMLPVALLGCLWWKRSRLTRRDLVRVLPYFGLSLLLALATIWFQSHRAIAEDSVRTDGFASRLVGAGWAVWFYLYKALLPWNLSFVYPKWQINAASPLAYLPGLAALGLLGLFWLKRNTWGKAPLAGFGYFVVSLFPVLGFFNIYFMNYSLVADHWQYFALPGAIALACGCAASLLKGSSQARQTAALTVACVLFVLTWSQQAIYHDLHALWNDTLARNPESRLAHMNMGTLLVSEGRAQEALPYYEKALALKPSEPLAHTNLGLAYEKTGMIDQAIACHKEAIRLKPDYAQAYSNLASALLSKGNLGEAAQAALDALQYDRSFAPAHLNLGIALFRQGKPQEALPAFEEAMRLAPSSGEAHYNLANALVETGKAEQAWPHYDQAIQLAPQDPVAHFNYGAALQRAGRAEQAIKEFQAALALNPSWSEAANRLAKLEGR